MPTGTAERVGVAVLAGHHAVHGVEGEARRLFRDLVTAGAKRRDEAHFAATGVGQRLEVRQVLGGVDAQVKASLPLSWETCSSERMRRLDSGESASPGGCTH